MKFLSAAYVDQLHDTLLQKWGGSAGYGPRGPDGLESAIQAVKNSYYEDPYEIAALYAIYVVQGHVFGDGNKRTGAAAMMTFLAANLLASSIAPSTLENAMFEIQLRQERGEATEKIVLWLAALLRP